MDDVTGGSKQRDQDCVSGTQQQVTLQDKTLQDKTLQSKTFQTHCATTTT
jgi:hypothetical protein